MAKLESDDAIIEKLEEQAVYTLSETLRNGYSSQDWPITCNSKTNEMKLL